MAKPALQVFSIDQSEEWDQIVRSFSCHDTYYLSGYVKAFQMHGDGEPLLFYYNDGQNRGINVSMKRSVAEDPHFKGIQDEDRYFDLATPYGYGGCLINGDVLSHKVSKRDRNDFPLIGDAATVSIVEKRRRSRGDLF